MISILSFMGEVYDPYTSIIFFPGLVLFIELLIYVHVIVPLLGFKQLLEARVVPNVLFDFMPKSLLLSTSACILTRHPFLAFLTKSSN